MKYKRDSIKLWLTTLVVFLLFSVFFLTPKAFGAPSQYITRGNTTEKVVALTIDDGSDGGNFSRILSVLNKHNVKGTFFLTGAGVEHHPQVVRNTASAGHDLGNHSYNHPYFTQISVSAMQSQLNRTETIIRNTTGRSSKPFFRAPFGATNQTVLNTVGNAGYTYTLHWTIDTLDWTGNSATTIHNRVVNNITPGAIVLMHTGAGASGTPQALDTMIPALKSRGYRFVTISQLLNLGNQPGTGTRYTVRAGDTLYSIARRYNITVARLAAANNISNVNVLRVGQVLVIPGTSTPTPPTGTRYTVRAGDTLYSIARRYNITVARLAAANNISNVNVLRVGQVLIIPGASTPTPPPTAVRHTVRAGETLYSIARRYNTTVARLSQLNNISNPNLLSVGRVLIIR